MINNRYKKNNFSPKRQDLMNNYIRFPKVLLIDENGESCGVMDTAEALKKAREIELDLVIINDKAETPIAKILDYGKYLYEKKRKIKDAKKNSAVIKVKEIAVKTNISDHDLEWKSKQAIEWLEDNNRVCFKIKAFGRTSTKIDLIHKVYERFVNLIGDKGAIQSELKKKSPVQHEAFFKPNKTK